MIITMTYPKRALELFSAACDYGDPFGRAQLFSFNIRRVQLGPDSRRRDGGCVFALNTKPNRTVKSKTKSPRG
jgi:hypothetical protein